MSEVVPSFNVRLTTMVSDGCSSSASLRSVWLIKLMELPFVPTIGLKITIGSSIFIDNITIASVCWVNEKGMFVCEGQHRFMNSLLDVEGWSVDFDRWIEMKLKCGWESFIEEPSHFTPEDQD